MTGENDETTVYQSEDGEELSFYQIAMRARKGTSDVEKAEDGYLVDRVKYKRTS